MKSSSKRFLAVLAVLVALPVGSVAGPPKGAAVPIRKTPIKSVVLKAKTHKITGTFAGFDGDSPVVEHAGDNSFGVVCEIVDGFIKENAEMANASMTLTPTVTIARTELVSVYYRRMIDTGGAHPASDFVALSYGIANGRAKHLNFSDLFKSGANANPRVLPLVAKKLRAKGVPVTFETGGVELPFTTKALKNWVITTNGVTFLFAAGEVTNYAAGEFKAHCTWRELESAVGPLSAVTKPAR